MFHTKNSNYVISLFAAFFLTACFFNSRAKAGDKHLQAKQDSITITRQAYKMGIIKKNFRFGFWTPSGRVIAPPHNRTGLRFLGADAATTEVEEKSDSLLILKVTNKKGKKAKVRVRLYDDYARFSVYPEHSPHQPVPAGTETENLASKLPPPIILRTGGVLPAFGLADQGGYPVGGASPASANLEGYKNDMMLSGTGERYSGRLESNFVIFPKQRFAELNIENSIKSVHLTKKENAQGSMNATNMPSMYYFFGSPETIYQNYRKVREENGYLIYKPKYELFGVGWEAWGALAWNTSQKTVHENVTRYLKLGYPIEWMVIGSGFWPRQDSSLHATTSFGMWDQELYPNPQKLIDQFHKKGLKVLLGLRISFIIDGPYSREGVKKGYFITKNGQSQKFSIAFPNSPVYLLDTTNSAAVAWYISLCEKWLNDGIDGFKEDLYGYEDYLLSDVKIDPVNEALMEKGVYVIQRNGYLGSAGDLHRYDDFNYNQPQDRGPLNGLAYAYSGFPYVYPDVVGGTGLTTGRFGEEPKEKLAAYLMRYAEYAALNPSMSFGYGPWNFSTKVVQITRRAANLHNRLQPYIYSNAIKAYKTGFPYPMVPLPLVYPDDPNVYGLADTTRRSYQWMIGESLLATPLYGDDYDTANSRNVYLPEGKWIEYDSGKIHEGPVTLENYPLPVGKTALFVGGTGIVVEDIDGQLTARLYPVDRHAGVVFYDKNGETRSRITIADPNWENPQITDTTTGEIINTRWSRHACEFPLIPGHDYRVE